MKVGEKLKFLRENNNMTRKDVADKLKEFGIDISDKTLYGYESGRNSANADMFLTLCKIYKCNNVMEVFSDTVDDVLFTNAEWNIIEKYRDLDDHGKEMVDFTLNKEHERSIREADKILEPPFYNLKNKNVSMVAEDSCSYSVNAAHGRTDIDVTDEMIKHDDDIMDDENF